MAYDKQKVATMLQQLNTTGTQPLAARDRLIEVLDKANDENARMSPVDEAVWLDDVVHSYNDYYGAVQSMFGEGDLDEESKKMLDEYMDELGTVSDGIQASIMEPMGLTDTYRIETVRDGVDGFVFDTEQLDNVTATMYTENLLGTVGKNFSVYVGPVNPNTGEPLSARGYYSATEFAEAGISPVEALTHLYDKSSGKMASEATAYKMMDAFVAASAARGGYVGGKENGMMPALIEREMFGQSLQTLGQDAMGKVPSEADSAFERAAQMRSVDALISATTRGKSNPYASKLGLANIAIRPVTIVESLSSDVVKDSQGRNVSAVDAFAKMAETRGSYKGLVSDLGERAVNKGVSAFKTAVEVVKNSRVAKFAGKMFDKAKQLGASIGEKVQDVTDDMRVAHAESVLKNTTAAHTKAMDSLNKAQMAKQIHLDSRRVPDVVAVETESAATEFGQ